MNKLTLGDNPQILKNLESESVNLIYLDLPFFSNRNYEVIWGDKGEIRSFEDRWSGSIDHYIAWLKERVAEMHRILKSTNNIKERISYPTQKLEKLLERIMLCASDENELILDLFVDGGTTYAVADKLKRQWIGICQSVQVIKLSDIPLAKLPSRKCFFQDTSTLITYFHQKC